MRINAPSIPDDQRSWAETFQELSKGNISKNVYTFFRDKEAMNNSTLLILWNNELRSKIEIKEFNHLFTKLRKLTLSTKLRYFQYRILIRRLTLNIHVQKWDPNVTDKCSFCDSSRETTFHIFFECNNVSKKIWKPLESWFKYMHKINIKFTPSIVLLNNYKGPFAD